MKCGKEYYAIKNHENNCCSTECANKGLRKFEIPKKELEQLVWIKPSMHITKDFGVSGKAIEKRRKLLGIKKPPRGYWQKRDKKLKAHAFNCSEDKSWR